MRATASIWLAVVLVNTWTGSVPGQEAEEAAPPAESGIATESDPEPESEAGPAPDLVCDNPTYDFNVVDNSEVVNHTFTIRNDGDATLDIQDVKPDCGCTVAQISSRLIAPGEEAELEVALKLKGRYGLQRKRIRIFSNDPDTPHYAVVITGTASSLINVSPRNLTVRGEIDKPIGVQTIKVTTAISHPLSLLSVDTGNPHVDAEFNVLHENFSFEVLLTPRETLPGGQTQGNLRIYTSSEVYPDITVPYMLIFADQDFVLAPKALVLHENPDQPVTRQFVIRPGLVKEFTVAEVITPNDEIEVDIRPVRDGTMIRLREMRVTRDLHEAVVRIITDVEGADPIDLPIRVLPKN